MKPYHSRSTWFTAVIAALVFIPAIGIAAETQDAFSPRGGASALVIESIEKAQRTLRVAAYTFTSVPIADAFISAMQRGIDVRVVLDAKASHQKSSLANYLLTAGIPVRLDDRHAITHDKFIVIDDTTVETGSFNYTKAAEHNNAENVVVIHDAIVAADYAGEWQKLWAEAEE